MLAAVATLAPGSALAGFGAYAHGYGIKSQGMAGANYTLTEETFMLSQNPAAAAVIAPRMDVGLDFSFVEPQISVRDNMLGEDETVHSNRKKFFIPQIGFVKRLDQNFSIGAAAFFAGLGTDYKNSPFRRFGTEPRISLGLTQVGVSLAMSYVPMPDQSLGLSLNSSYQELRVTGVQSFSALSQNPEKFSDRGKDPALGVGLTLGWMGKVFLPNLRGALSYRTKTWTERAKEYAGLIPDGGNIDLPATFGGGLAWSISPAWHVMTEFQRYMYSSEALTGNKAQDPITGAPFGSRQGGGLGWRNQNIYRFGLAHDFNDCLRLRMGYIATSKLVPPSETFFGAFAPSIFRDHYTVGATWNSRHTGWEVTAYASYSPTEFQNGENSIPEAFGGGEIDMEAKLYTFGMSMSRRFGIK